MSLFREGFMWNPVSTYADVIFARSELRGWGLDQEYIESALAGIRDHQDVLHPSATKLFLGKGAAYDWAEANIWLADTLVDIDYGRYFDDCSMVCNAKHENWFQYARNSGPVDESVPELAPSYLDMDSFHLQQEVAWNDRPMMMRLIDRRDAWPGTDLVWLFALNPEMFVRGWDRWMSRVKLYVPGIVLTNEPSDQAARDCGFSTGWGFVPEFQTSGPVVSFAHRSGSVGAGMCFVSYAS